MERNILRQIADVQQQAERLISTNAEQHEIEDFSKYNEEIKSYLLENVKDNFILKRINEIPSINFNTLEIKDNFLILIFSIFSGGLAAYYRRIERTKEALAVVREIRGKYASAEFMLKNYFTA